MVFRNGALLRIGNAGIGREHRRSGFTVFYAHLRPAGAMPLPRIDALHFVLAGPARSSRAVMAPSTRSHSDFRILAIRSKFIRNLLCSKYLPK
jgi:hypothetical protein